MGKFEIAMIKKVVFSVLVQKYNPDYFTNQKTKQWEQTKVATPKIDSKSKLWQQSKAKRLICSGTKLKYVQDRRP